MEKFTIEQVSAVLRQVVESDPDRRVTECRYVDEAGRPDCVVGHVLFRLGLDLPEYGIEDNYDTWFTLKENWFPDVFDSDAATLLAESQAIQDEADFDKAADFRDVPVSVSVEHPGRPWRAIVDELL